MTLTESPRRSGQRGSALMIVFAFAAIVAIMLYKELPVAAFEARRNKEELLVERGNEYKRAVKLYVRKFQTFPASIEALESTNRMRFLRHKYVDPFTGNADWRLLHAGPGGMIIDSKVKQTGMGIPGAPGNGTQSGFGSLGSTSFNNGGSTSSFGSNSLGGNSFGGGGFGSNNSNSGSSFGSSFGNNISQSNDSADPLQANSAVVPTRPPAISVNGGGGMNAANSDMPAMNVPQEQQAVDSSNQAPMPNVGAGDPATGANVPYAGYPGPPTATANGQSVNNPMMTSSMPMNPSTGLPMNATSSMPFMRRYPMNAGMATSSYPSSGDTDPQSGAPQTNPMPNPLGSSQAGSNIAGNTVGGFGNAQPAQQQQSAFGSNATGNSSGMGITSSGGIAGVASKAKGKTIKTVNDQTELSLWEFYYDMRKEANALAPGLGGGTGLNNGINNSQNGLQNGSQSNLNSTGSSFGQSQPSQSSGFGNNSQSAPVQTSNQPQN